MMKAIEMFEEIGYTYEPEEILTHLICYEKKGDYFRTSLVFNTIIKDLFIYQYNNDGTNCRAKINIPTHCAIHQQMIELGWLDAYRL